MLALEWFDGKTVDPQVYRAAVRVNGKIASLSETDFVEAIAEAFSVFIVKCASNSEIGFPNGFRCTFWLDRASIEFYPTRDSIYAEMGNVMVGLMTGNLRQEWIRCAKLDDGKEKAAFNEAIRDYQLSLIPIVSKGIGVAFMKDRSLKEMVADWVIEYWDSDRFVLSSVGI